MGHDQGNALVLEAVFDDPGRLGFDISERCHLLRDGTMVRFGIVDRIMLDGSERHLQPAALQALCDMAGIIRVESLGSAERDLLVLWQCALQHQRQITTAATADLLVSRALREAGCEFSGRRLSEERWGQVARSGWIDGRFQILL